MAIPLNKFEGVAHLQEPREQMCSAVMGHEMCEWRKRPVSPGFHQDANGEGSVRISNFLRVVRDRSKWDGHYALAKKANGAKEYPRMFPPPCPKWNQGSYLKTQERKNAHALTGPGMSCVVPMIISSF